MDNEEIKKTYLAPEYDDHEDDDFDEEIDEDGEDEAVENFLDRQESLKNNNSNNKSSMSTSAFGSSPSSWGQPNNQTSWGSTSNNIWGSNTNQLNNNSSPWGMNSGNNSPWQKPASGNNFSWGTGNGSWGSSLSGEKKEINRKKRVIICDVLDCLVETYQSNGKPGLLPRGIYDMRLRFEVWDKIACFNPEKVFAMVPRALLNSSNGSDSWKVMLDYIVCSFSEYLRSPYQVCQIILQTRIGQPKEELIQQVLGNIAKDDIIQIGVNSGLYGQNNKDQMAAMICGIDYIDLGTFMSSYF